MRPWSRFLHHLAHIASRSFPPGPGSLRDRVALARVHATIASRAALSRKGDYTLREIDLLGERIRFHYWRDLHRVFDEVFLDRIYSFPNGPGRGVIVDAGANIGLASVWFAKNYPGRPIVAIEPDADAFGLLERNLADVPAEVSLHRVALGRSEGSVLLRSGAGELASPRTSVERQAPGDRTVEVPMTRLSRLIDFDVALLKLDVEGAEFEVMQDLEESGAIGRIGAMVIEYHHHLHDGADRLGDFLGFLERGGFAYLIDTPDRLPAGALDVQAHFQDVMIRAKRAIP